MRILEYGNPFWDFLLKFWIFWNFLEFFEQTCLCKSSTSEWWISWSSVVCFIPSSITFSNIEICSSSFSRSYSTFSLKIFWKFLSIFENFWNFLNFFEIFWKFLKVFESNILVKNWKKIQYFSIFKKNLSQ